MAQNLGKSILTLGVDGSQMTAGMKKAQGDMAKTGKSAKDLNTNLRFMRGGVGQLGHQFQDIAVQVQGGTDAMIVFGQQGSQIASLFGPGGAVLGAVLAIGAAAAGPLIEAFTGSSKALKELRDSALEATPTLDKLTGALRAQQKIATRRELKALLIDQEKALNKLNETTDVMERLDLKSLIQAGAVEIERLKSVYRGLNPELQAQIEALETEHRMYGATATEIAIYNAMLDGQITEQEQSIIALTEKIQTLEEEEAANIAARKAAEKKAAADKKAAEDLKRTNDKAEKAFGSMLKSVMNEREQIQQELNERHVIISDALAAGRISVQEASDAVTKIEADAVAQRIALAEKEGAEKAKLRDKAKAFTVSKELMSPIEQINFELSERRRLIQEAYGNETQFRTEKEAAITAIEQIASKKRLELSQKEQKKKDKLRQEAMKGLGDQLMALDSNNKKVFQMQKAYRMAEATMAAYQGATNALAAPFPFPIPQVMAGAALTLGLANVAQIKAQSFEGGGFTGYGARAGGLDGKGGRMAMIHPNETVVDHRNGGAAGVTIVNNVDARGAGADVDQKIKIAMAQTSHQTVLQVQDLIRRKRLV